MASSPVELSSLNLLRQSSDKTSTGENGPDNQQYQAIKEPENQFGTLVSSLVAIIQASSCIIRRFLVTWKAWKWEMIACFIVLASPFVILATLYPHDGNLLPQTYGPFKIISINALLSFHSIVLKASLAFVIASCIGQLQWAWFAHGRPLYDLVRYSDATGSPWGCIKLLLAQRLRHPLTTLGGVLVVLSIGIAPSIQMLMNPFDCSIELGVHGPTLPRTNLYSYNVDPSPSRPSVITEFSKRDMTQSDGPHFDCITGNCSFPDLYGTIGYCSSCEDISDDIHIEMNCSVGTSTRSIKIVDECPKTSNTTLAIRYRLPTNLSITTTWRFDSTSGWYIDGKESTVVAKVQAAGTGRNVTKSKHITARILIGQSARLSTHDNASLVPNPLDCKNQTSVDPWRCRGYGAASCVLSPCVRVYNATIRAGGLTERVVAQSGHLPWGASPGALEGMFTGGARGMVDAYCLGLNNNKINGSIISDGEPTINQTDRWLPYDITFVDGNISPTVKRLLAQKCLYMIRTVDLEAQLAWLLSGNIRKLPAPFQLDHTPPIYSYEGKEALKHIYNFGDVDFGHIQQTFSNISDSITDHFRMYGVANYSEPAIGKTVYAAICLHVRWQWITLPSLLAVLTTALFVMTVRSNPCHRFPPWKASFLPWIMCGPGGSEIFHANGLEKNDPYGIDAMERRSREITVTWKPLPQPRVEM
ncbi:hypothetical protein F4810DRAFT_720666 [Camillea tinctor]|nr:hypothetical protein F4810DRAFT_720666 [Camillea tinctor]